MLKEIARPIAFATSLTAALSCEPNPVKAQEPFPSLNTTIFPTEEVERQLGEDGTFTIPKDSVVIPSFVPISGSNEKIIETFSPHKTSNPIDVFCPVTGVDVQNSTKRLTCLPTSEEREAIDNKLLLDPNNSELINKLIRIDTELAEEVAENLQMSPLLQDSDKDRIAFITLTTVQPVSFDFENL